MKEQKYRQPTIEEAVFCVCRELNSRAFRNECIEFWRNHYGDQFADEVKATATEILIKRKSGKSKR